MIGNTQGIYLVYSNKNLSMQMLNIKINASNCSGSAIYLMGMTKWSSIYFKDIEIFYSKKVAIEAYYIILFINQLNISSGYQGISFNNEVKCQAENLKIVNTVSRVINLEKNCSFYCSNCEFANNNDSIITASSYSNLSLINSQIFSNSLKHQNLFFFSEMRDQVNYFINCQIYSNSLISGSLIYLSLSSLTINSSSIIENEGYSTSIKPINSYNSKLNIYNSKLQFNTFVENGAFIYAVDGSIIIAENTNFENSKSEVGNIYGNNIDINIKNCTFSGNSGGDIYIKRSTLYIMNCNFENLLLTSSYSGVLTFENNYNIVISGIKVKNIKTKTDLNNLAYVYDESSNKLEIFDSMMIGFNNLSMALYAKESFSIVVKNSIFIGFNTKDYSPLTLISNSKTCNMIIIDSKITENRSTKNGGGIYLENYKLIIESSEISFNQAKHSGGGLYFISPECKECKIYLLGKSKIFNNSCDSDGGAIKWKDYKPFIESSVLIYNNTAAYGPNLASTPAKLGLSGSGRLKESILTTLSNVPPGKRFTEVIQINIFDIYGQVVYTENSISAELSINETEDSTVAISGITFFKARDGVINVSDFILTGTPGSSAYLKLKSDNMIGDSIGTNPDYSNSAYFMVEFRNCTKGEQIQASACVDCSGGSYNLEASENCFECPVGALCPGRDAIIVKNGYWRSSLESNLIYSCDVFEACLKGSEINELGNCSKGYTGVLCKSCEIGYSKTANGICTKCPPLKTNIIIMIVLSIGIIFLSFILVKTTFTSAFSPKSLHSIYIKIFTNYLQLVFIVTQLDLEWPPYIIEFFNIQKSTASVTDQLISLDCYIMIKSSVDYNNVYYTKLIIISALPIVITVISYFYWIFHSSLIESYNFLKREALATIIVLFFLVYPNIIKFMFANFSCVKIDKMSSYLNENTFIECWDSNHKKYSFLIAIPSIILWVIGIPTLLLFIMTKNKKRLHLDYYRVVFGFLYNGYKQDRYYWEIIIMYRKIILITITVSEMFQARAAQALNLIGVLIASIYIHHSNKPYYNRELNNMEMQALNIAAMTIYFGLYYLSKSIQNSIQILLFIFIIVGNSYFILNWAYFIGRAFADIFIKAFPRFRSLIKRGDAFDEDFNNEEIVRKGIYLYQPGGQKAYSFLNMKKKIENAELKYRSMEDAYIDVAKRDVDKIYRTK